MDEIDLGEYEYIGGKLFVDQAHYENLGDNILLYIQKMMENQFGLIRINIPLEPDIGGNKSYVYISPNTDCEIVMFLVQGSGAVRPGQWARALCINDSLETGSILPQLQMCQERGWGCCVFNPNQRCDYPLGEHGHSTYVFNQVVIPRFTQMKHILAVAHSAGGFAVSSLLLNSPLAMKLLRGIAFTDSFYHVAGLDKEQLKQFYGCAVHWRCNESDLNKFVNDQQDDIEEDDLEIVDNQCVTISAGTRQHEMSTGMAQYSIYQYFDAKMKQIRDAQTSSKIEKQEINQKEEQESKGEADQTLEDEKAQIMDKDSDKPEWLERILILQTRYEQWIENNVSDNKKEEKKEESQEEKLNGENEKQKIDQGLSQCFTLGKKEYKQDKITD
ncbi:MAG: putative argonaute binding protein [Streblomastix strix]|uniref:Putative argonaute binding protein n=1 Tax=Streblomastix strix TaxID=222440 RepID=A0A5J4WB77_9EUKA|nr:MAG: putative argonaute binding protein [Streblomastix strix]